MSDRLAIHGGQPVRTKPFAPWPHFSGDEIATVVSILRSGKVNYWTGEQGRRFEAEFADYCGCRHAIAVANGSVALELALMAFGVGPGDEVIVPSRTFIASASCAVLRGAIPVFADVDRVSQTVTEDTIRAVLSPRTRAIIVVHLAGWPCDMDSITALAREHSIAVIEDCAQAHGASYWGRRVGSLGDAAAFSFCQDKIISTGGEGGMVVTSRRDIWERVWQFKDHGRNYALSHATAEPGFRWIHDTFGTNFRLTEIQSALGRVQLGRLDKQVEGRRRNAAALTGRFRSIPALRVTEPSAGVGHSYYKYYVFVKPEQLSPEWNRDRILAAIVAEGVPCATGICSEVYLEKAFPAEWHPALRLPIAQELGATSLMFMVHPTLSYEHINDTCIAVEKVMRIATQHVHQLSAASSEIV
ncbi:MAG: DegT/DnrJ/EryC1/StrS aminotransferase family protein [Acidobacteriia bacterium]|nr:DegT/DnrJ/EryC1/StrS aminotransferase family protein [Terriglobia bacterium]